MNQSNLTISRKLLSLNWFIVFLVAVISGIGCLMLYSAANGSWFPWAYSHVIRFSIGMTLMLSIAVVDIRFWMRNAYLLYMIILFFLLVVSLMGEIAMGAQRWIKFSLFHFQPSEFMKICLILALSRYFNGLTYEEIGKKLKLIIPLLMVGIPVFLVLKEPDLGTALIMIAESATIFFLAGVRIWKFFVLIVTAMLSFPLSWHFLREYQQKRILTFLNPDKNESSSGYHILQSKIALGSGGIFGKGFLRGSQSHLNFLPAKQTDFIFTMLAEEFGIFGGTCLIGLYTLILAYGFFVAIRSSSQFGRLVALGVTTTLFLYLFINIAMTVGLIPVVGVPLPMLSYGGTAMLTIMIGLGLLLGVSVHRCVRISSYWY
ncbi:rod shape-determining protein RodA [Candidatus Endolissoclinum faulkneri L5]|uniref:Peptidoglycan glycosyltransferase MrdB n=1 Tax=Candidatus Endolissoclinum faulkneri L5 TaxID=1401328 RepID=V9TTH4_9PROT|nr:rod shape-determining protein RodA [Candidatus Endolissoclinum faulkneri]AHC73901.1 rod shape-determining protein RodA [Candidatus Endolissoclinum faulkneri L5]